MWATAIVWGIVTAGTIFAGYVVNYDHPKSEPQTQVEWCMANGNHRDPAVRNLHAKYCGGI
jgi:hypothetical protein